MTYIHDNLRFAMLAMLLLSWMSTVTAQHKQDVVSKMTLVIQDTSELDSVAASAGGQQIFEYPDIDRMLGKPIRRKDRVRLIVELVHGQSSNPKARRRTYYAINALCSVEEQNQLPNLVIAYSAGRLVERLRNESDALAKRELTSTLKSITNLVGLDDIDPNIATIFSEQMSVHLRNEGSSKQDTE